MIEQTTTNSTAQAQRIKGTRTTYPAELKAQALAQVAAGHSIAGTARDLGIVEGTLGMWVAETRKAAGPVAPAEVEPQTLAELRAALTRTMRERDALKAALASVASAMGG